MAKRKTDFSSLMSSPGISSTGIAALKAVITKETPLEQDSEATESGFEEIGPFVSPSQEEEIASMQEELALLRERNKELELENARLDDEVTETKKEYASRNELVAKLEAENAEKQKRIDQLEEENARLKSSQMELRKYTDTSEIELKDKKQPVANKLMGSPFDEKREQLLRSRAEATEARMVSNRPIVALHQNIRFTPIMAKHLGSLTVQLFEATGYDFTVTDLVNEACEYMWYTSQRVPGFLCKLQDNWEIPATSNKEEQKQESRRCLQGFLRKILT